jgi:hypothetical protein
VTFVYAGVALFVLNFIVVPMIGWRWRQQMKHRNWGLKHDSLHKARMPDVGGVPVQPPADRPDPVAARDAGEPTVSNVRPMHRRHSRSRRHVTIKVDVADPWQPATP